MDKSKTLDGLAGLVLVLLAPVAHTDRYGLRVRSAPVAQIALQQHSRCGSGQAVGRGCRGGGGILYPLKC